MKKDLYKEIRDKVREAVGTVYDTATSKCKVYVTKSGKVYTKASGQYDNNDTHTLLYTIEEWIPTIAKVEDWGYYDDESENEEVVELCGRSCQENFVERYVLSLEQMGEMDRIYKEAKNFIEE